MASIDKIQLASSSTTSTTHYISVSPNSNIIGYTSGDASIASWKSTGLIENTDDNSTIFNKVTTMIANMRKVYSLLSNKSNTEHTHTTSQINSGKFSTSRLPISDDYSSSTTTIPTSRLINTLNTAISEFATNTTVGSDITTNITCGGIPYGTSISSTDKLRDITKNMIAPPYYDAKIDEWNSKADVDAFFTKHTYANGWKELTLGNYVTINDGTYNKDWVIAGFDCETASDGVVGGIVFIPRNTNLTDGKWHSTRTGATSYINSYMHTTLLPAIYNNLAGSGKVLEGHIVQRNVKLGSAQNGTGIPTGWTQTCTGLTSATTDTVAYLTLMSATQLTGDLRYNNLNDNGEANYKLPLFDYLDLDTYCHSSTNLYPWLRNVYGIEPDETDFVAWRLYDDEISPRYALVDISYGVRPLMYLR